MDQDNGIPLSLCMERIQKSTDVMAAEAEYLFYDCEYKKSLQVLNEYVQWDMVNMLLLYKSASIRL